ncbi:MAG: DUF6516 family protein [Bdellovibrionales bacterium]
MDAAGHELEFLLSLNGYEFRFSSGYRIRLAARRAKPSKARPHGVKYSLTLHAPDGKRVYGMDNAHKIAGQKEFDHRHIYGAHKILGYRYRGPAELLEDFYREVERILGQEGT